MARRQYSVTVRYEQEKDITVWAEDEDAAAEKACDLVEAWAGVISAEAGYVEEA